MANLTEAKARPVLGSVKRLAALMDVSERKLWQMHTTGQMPIAIRIARSVKWRLDEIETWIAAGRALAGPLGTFPEGGTVLTECPPLDGWLRCLLPCALWLLRVLLRYCLSASWVDTMRTWFDSRRRRGALRRRSSRRPRLRRIAFQRTQFMAKTPAIIPAKRIDRTILLIRGERVILDADLAQLFGASTKALNQAVKRNRERFPADFMFRLTARERAEVVTNCDHLARLRFSPTPPWAFTEHGVIMAANVLNSRRAVKASLFVVRAFVRLRRFLATHEALGRKLDELERKLEGHDAQIVSLFDAIRELMEPPPEPRRTPIGYLTEAQGSAAKKARA